MARIVSLACLVVWLPVASLMAENEPAALWIAPSDRPFLLRGQDSPYDEPLVTDRPDFTEASSTVGRHVLQIESGYTFLYRDTDEALEHAHSGPEMLVRYGVSEMLELRLYWSYLWERATSPGVIEDFDGADDLRLGIKVDVTEECGWRPESALIIAMAVPTGADAFSTDRAELALNYCYSWELPHAAYLGLSTGYETSAETGVGPAPFALPLVDRHHIFWQSVATGISLNDHWGAYIEYFGIFSDGLADEYSENYIDGGFTYLINNNNQLDIRAGKGLNEDAYDFFGGVGYSVRF